MSRCYAEVVGDPVAHSKSPLIHGFWLQKLDMAADYRRAHVRRGELESYLQERRRDPAWRGCNVTVPHKVAALEAADRASGTAAGVGAANCLVRGSEGELAAHNTDVAGFLRPLGSRRLQGGSAAVVGAGGAARAVLAGLAQLGLAEVTVLNRTVAAAAALLAEFGLKGKALPLDAPLPPAELLVNASTLGMAGAPPLTLDLQPLPQTATVYDIVYAPLETPLLAAARRRGLDTVDGLSMLIGQAREAFELFFGTAAPAGGDAELRALLTA